MKTGLVIAAAAAALFVAGCACQGSTCPTQCPPAQTSTCACKGMASCKGMSSCKSTCATNQCATNQCPKKRVKGHRKAAATTADVATTNS